MFDKEINIRRERFRDTERKDNLWQLLSQVDRSNVQQLEGIRSTHRLRYKGRVDDAVYERLHQFAAVIVRLYDIRMACQAKE